MQYMLRKMSLTLTSCLIVSLGLTAAHASPLEDVEKVRAELVKMVPPASDAPILETAVNGIYRLELDNGFYYAYVDGDHILFGDLVNTKDKVNLGEQAKSERTAALIEGTPMGKMIVYGPKDAKRHVTVFTDIDCGYCRKLHLEVPKLNEATRTYRAQPHPPAAQSRLSCRYRRVYQ